MWSLKNISTSKRHYFVVGKEYTVGRKDSDILILDDMSISRKHAILRVNHTEKNVLNGDKLSELILKDISKLGTQLPGKRISNGDEEMLKEAEVVSFGTSSNNKFQVFCEPLMVTASCLPGSSKKSLKKLLFKLGGSLLNEWTNKCTYVVMVNLSLTVKVACALLSQKHIVNLSYFEELLKHMESNDVSNIHDILPPSDYLPVMAESQLNPSDVSFAPLPQRSSIFKDKSFIFLLSEQLARLKPVIQLASGAVKFIDVTDSNFKMNTSVKECLREGCIILPESNENSVHHQDKIQLIITCLNRSHRRLIPESEVGFAILYCSTQQYCNPEKKFNHPSLSSQPPVLQQTKIKFPNIPSENLKNSENISNEKNFNPKENIETIENTPARNNLNKLDKKVYNSEILEDSVVEERSGLDASCNMFPGHSEVVEGIKDKNSGIKQKDKNERMKRKYVADTQDDIRASKVFKTELMDARINEKQTKDLFSDSISNSSNIVCSTNKSCLTHPTNPQPPSQLLNCLNTRSISSKYLDTTFEALKTVEGKCTVLETDLVVRNEKALLVEWNGRMILNYKRFVKISSITKSTSIIRTGDLFIQPSRDLDDVDLKMDNDKR